MNVITIAGNLGKDAELRHTQNGDAVASFSVADSMGRDKPTTWKEIPGHQGYAVNVYGEVKSIARVVTRKNGACSVRERILRPKVNTSGYLAVKLLPARKNSTQLVHRLVMMAFRKPDIDRPHVNHINGDKRDNRLENLEWTNRSENSFHAYRVLGVKPRNQKKLGESPISKPVVGVKDATREIVRLPSLSDGIAKGFTVSGICAAINGRQHTHRGYRWAYESKEGQQ